MRPEFMIERQGKTFCLYAGLLDEAHQQGLKQIETVIIQIPTKENGGVAICQAIVTTEKGVFSGVGDASPTNVNKMMANCLLRMAETRAKARALRDAINVGVAALEELGDEDDTPVKTRAAVAPTAPVQNASQGHVEVPQTAFASEVEGVTAPVTGENYDATPEGLKQALNEALQEASKLKWEGKAIYDLRKSIMAQQGVVNQIQAAIKAAEAIREGRLQPAVEG